MKINEVPQFKLLSFDHDYHFNCDMLLFIGMDQSPFLVLGQHSLVLASFRIILTQSLVVPNAFFISVQEFLRISLVISVVMENLKVKHKILDH